MGSYTICKSYSFDAAHQIKVDKVLDHKCKNLHGHTYTVEIYLRSTRLKNGMVKDFCDLSDVIWFIGTHLDHKYLNDVKGLEQPTAEHIARFIYRWVAKRHTQCFKVRVHETPTCWAEYEEEK